MRAQASRGFPRSRMLRVMLVAISLGIVVGVASAHATTQTKFYGASVSGPAGGAAANARVTYTLTLKNESTSTQSLGSADFWAPSGWTVNSVPSAPVLSPDGHTWNISEKAGTPAPDGSAADAVLFRAATNGDALAPGQNVSASVDATAPCTAGTVAWQTEAKQANNFSGQPGNDFQPTAGDVNTSVTVLPAGLGRLAFDPIATQQTGVTFTVTVKAYDTCGNPKTDYSGGATLTGNLTGISSPYPLTWGVGTGVGTADLTPTASQFSARLHVQDAAVAADSNTFEVADAAKTCTANSGTCELSDANGTTTFDAPAPTGSQSLSIGVLSGSLVSSFAGCSTSGPLSGESIVTVDPSGYSGPFTVTLTYAKAIAPGTGVANFVVCKSNDDGVTWTALSLCKNNHPSPPCIASRSRTGVGDLVETLLVDPNDPAWGTS